MSDHVSSDAYPLIEKMRTVFEEVLSMLRDDEARLREAYYELQQERDKMRSELLFWRAEAQRWKEERHLFEQERKQWQPSLPSASASPSLPSISRDGLSGALREAPTAPPATATPPPREPNLDSRMPPKEYGRPLINYDYYNPHRESEATAAPVDTQITSVVNTNDPLERKSTARYEGEDNDQDKQLGIEEKMQVRAGALTTVAPQVAGDLVNSSTNTNRDRQALPNSFWIYVWPAFGSSAPLYIEPAKVFVYGHYRYMEDVTEKAAKALHCQPAPSCLHEPDGTPVRSLRLLVPNQHYIIFPSGAYYRPSAVPQRLLNALVRNAQQVLNDIPI